MSSVEIEQVEDKNNNEKLMAGRPPGVNNKFHIPTGESDIDWRCPVCGEVGSFSKRKRGAGCANRHCRIQRFNIFVDNIEVGDDD